MPAVISSKRTKEFWLAHFRFSLFLATMSSTESRVK